MTTKEMQKKLSELSHEVAQLKRDVAFAMPQESISEFRNAVDIKRAYKNAVKKHPTA